jgi:hypothetical protein
MWVVMSDPVLRSAMEYATARADSARQRTRYGRRRIALALSCLTLAALCTRALLWLVL